MIRCNEMPNLRIYWLLGLIVSPTFVVAQYTATVITPGSIWEGLALGNNGYVAYGTGTAVKRFSYLTGVTETLGNLADSSSCYVTGISSNGTIIGERSVGSDLVLGTTYRTTIWTGSTAQSLPANGLSSWGMDVSDTGYIVGNALNRTGSVTYGYGWRYSVATGVYENYPAPGMFNQSSYEAISPDGHAYGGLKASSPDNSVGYLFNNWGAQTFSPAPSYTQARIKQISNDESFLLLSSKDVGGTQYSASEVVSPLGVRTAIPGFGGRFTTGNFRNIHGVVAGGATDADGFSVPFLWSSATGTISLKPMLATLGYSFGTVWGLNDQGQILMQASNSEGSSMVLFTPAPVPEPATVFALTAGIGLLAKRRRRTY